LPKIPKLYPRHSSGHSTKGTKERKYYTPSLSAELAGLSAKGGQKRGFTGLEIRPMIEHKSKNYMPLSAGKEPKGMKLKRRL